MTLLLLRAATRPFGTLDRIVGSVSAEAARELLELDGQLSRLGGRVGDALFAAAGPSDSSATSPDRPGLIATRRDVHNRRPVTAEDLERAARHLDREHLKSLQEHMEAVEAYRSAERSWAEAFRADLLEARRALARELDDPLVEEGIATVARALAEKARRVAARAPGGWGHGERHVASKVLAYLARFATKTSPNSLFCATALAWARGPLTSVRGRPRIGRRKYLLSVAEARKVACVLAGDPDAEDAIRVRPNPTLRDEDGGLTFWRFASLRRASDDEIFSRAKDHPVLRAALGEAAAGVALPELRRRLAIRTGLAESDLGSFLRQAIELGALIGEIEIPYNEARPLRYVARTSRDAGCDLPWIEPALAIENAVDGLETIAAGARPDAVAAVCASLRALPHARPIQDDEACRVDAVSELEVALPASVIECLRGGLRPYTRLFAALYPARRYRQGWVDRFLRPFPADTDVSLLDVYRRVTEEGETYRPAAFPEPSPERDGDGDLSRRAMHAVRAHLSTPAEELVLDDAALDRLVPGLAEPRWACGVLFQIAAKDAAAIDAGAYRLVLNGLFQGAGLSLSRFANLLGGDAGEGNPVVRELRRAWSVIARPEAIVAELTYNHLGRTANAGLRPRIFEHEIELPGDCASKGAQALGLRDLVVRWDTMRGRFVLRRAWDGTEVIPVINSGVNPVGFVSFLVAIGEQALQPIGYLPGFDLPGVTHWPRVTAGKVVLFREHWIFRPGEWPSAPHRGDDLVPFARESIAWRSRWKLPRHVFVHTSEDPKPKYADLESPLFLDLLRRDLGLLDGKAGATLWVTEMLPGPGDLWVRDTDGGYATEFLVQMDGGSLESGP